MRLEINKDVKKNINYIKKEYGESSDLITRTIKIGKKEIGYTCLESVCSDDKISDFLMKNISSYVKHTGINIFKDLFTSLENSIPNSNLSKESNLNNIFYKLSAGFTCIFVEGNEECIIVETKTTLDRGITESSSQAIIRGPKDSFTENHQKNIGLIRKRIKDQNLWFKDTVVGTRTKTKVTLGYLKDIADDKHIENLTKQIEKINVDGILDSGYIREFLTIDKSSSFPQLISSERPDIVCGSLLEGKIVILVENSPFALILPGLFVDFLHSAEDYYQKPINTSLTRLLRTLAFFLTIITPAFYIAVTTWNQEIIPHELLISLAVQRDGVPFPTALEVFLMVTVFEVLREADIRTPTATGGAAISTVGALILGEAAVSAGIVSPIVIIVVALTSISGLLYSDIDFINGIRWWRLIFMFFATILGLIGFIIAGLIFVVRLCSLESLGIPYLTPISPTYVNSLKDSIIRFPRTMQKYRSKYLAKKNIKRIGENK